MHNPNPVPAQYDQDSMGTAQPEPDILNHLQSVESHLFDVNRDYLRKQRIIAGMDSCEYVNAYKVLRTRVLQKMRERGWNTLAVVSPNGKAGTTISAINLAISLALEINQTVVLVDANLRNPSVHRYFGIAPKHGLADYLLDNIPIKNLILHPRGIGQFMILPGSRPLSNSAEMLSSPQMASLVVSMKKHDTERLIIYDLSDLQTADALAFIPLVDAVLLVIDASATIEEELMLAIEHLHGIPIIGTLLNKSEQFYRD